MVHNHIPEEYMKKGRKFAAYFGWSAAGERQPDGTPLPTGEDSSMNRSVPTAIEEPGSSETGMGTTFVYLATSYAIVKVKMDVTKISFND